jgi:S1-C subfamily serine protease
MIDKETKMNQELKNFSAGLADAVENAGDYTVSVMARRRLPASGITLDDVHILTAAHVIEDDEKIMVGMPDGSQQKAELLGYDPNSDLAVLKLEKPAPTPALLEEQVRVGELVLAIGRPFQEIQASLGTLSAKGGPTHNRRGGILEGHFRTDATPYPGFSGGPLINSEGKVVGINTSGLTHGSSIAIPIAVAVKIAEMLKEHGTIKRGYLGISGQPVQLPEEAASSLNREQENGLLIVGMEEEGPAAKGGLMVGDILVGLAGNPIESHQQLLVRLAGEMVGQETELEVLRGGKPTALKVTIEERPDVHSETRKGRHFGRWGMRRKKHHGHHHKRRNRGPHPHDDED